MDKNGQRFPSALIPFCAFGGDMSAMGTMMDQIEIPICNSFEPKVLNDQLCYEVDLDRFSNKTNRDKEMKDGFIFLMDYNEDRQKTIQAVEEVVEKNIFTQMVKTDYNQHAVTYVNTIGMPMSIMMSNVKYHYF